MVTQKTQWYERVRPHKARHTREFTSIQTENMHVYVAHWYVKNRPTIVMKTRSEIISATNDVYALMRVRTFLHVSKREEDLSHRGKHSSQIQTTLNPFNFALFLFCLALSVATFLSLYFSVRLFLCNIFNTPRACACTHFFFPSVCLSRSLFRKSIYRDLMSHASLYTKSTT